MKRWVAVLPLGFALLFVPGCLEVLVPAAAEGLGKSDCKTDADPRVSPDRTVLLTTRNYLYIDPAWNDQLKDYYITLYKGKIPKIYDELNKYFDQKDLNVVIFDSPLEVVENADGVEADADYYGPKRKTAAIVVAVAKSDTEHIHVHWHISSLSVAMGYSNPPNWEPYSDFNWIGMCDINFKSTSEHELALTLAHEFGHFCVFDAHVKDSNNLMADSPGEELTAGQISDIWGGINKQRKHLTALSCKKE